MIEDHEPPRPSTIVDRILGSRSDRRAEGPERVAEGTAAYTAYKVTEGFPRMGFTLAVYHRTTSGLTLESHGIMFHDVKKPKYKSFDGSEYVNFSHAGEAYTLRGRGLYSFYLGLMESTLQTAIVFEPAIFAPIDDTAPIIDRMAVTDVAEMVRRNREGRDH